MNMPKVSVIIPAYNQADLLGEAIQSVLDQTYHNLEVVVVNDASPDHSGEVVRQFSDPRIKYILHEKNLGLAATRNTGIRNSTGEIIALLDGDDLFHPEKLQIHIDFLRTHPDISITYNSRFEFTDSARSVREIVRPPLTITLTDIVLSYPFAPSEMVLRREVFSVAGLFNESFVYFGEDGDMYSRLALAGYKFASVDRALSYRRRHSGRVIKDLDFGVNEELRWLNNVFIDPRCPSEVLDLRDLAFAHFYMFYSPLAFAQGETSLGQDFIRKALHLHPSARDAELRELVNIFINYSIADETRDPEAVLGKIFNQLPAEISSISDRLNWAISRAYLLKGVRDIIWNRSLEGQASLTHAAELGAKIDETFLQSQTQHLFNYEIEFGSQATYEVLQNLSHCLKRTGYPSEARKLMSLYSIIHAFKDYKAEKYSEVPKDVIRAIMKDAQHLNNRGVMSILSRSILNEIRNKL